MKKLLSFLLIVICILTFFTSCGYSNTIEGIENFSALDSDVSICWQLIPTDFIEKFEYIDGNYHFSTSEKYPFMSWLMPQTFPINAWPALENQLSCSGELLRSIFNAATSRMMKIAALIR